MSKESGEDQRLHDDTVHPNGRRLGDGDPQVSSSPSLVTGKKDDLTEDTSDEDRDWPPPGHPPYPDNTQEDQSYEMAAYQQPDRESDASRVPLKGKDNPVEEDPYRDPAYYDDYPKEESPHQDYHRHEDHEPNGSDSWLDEDEEAGGPVKSFLEHLEDLRWVLIKCLSAIIIGMVVCLVAANKMIEVLMEPLEKAKITLMKDTPVVTFSLGTNKLGSFDLDTNLWSAFLPPNVAPQRLNLELVPMRFGTNTFLGVHVSDREPVSNDRIVLKNYSPVGGFVVALQLGLYGGIGLASPFVMFFIGDFVLPALKRKEKKFLYRAVIYGGGLFIVGVLFCYFLLLPIALFAAANFSNWLNFQANEWRAEDYVSFISKFMLGMGISFELPVVILTLVKLNIVDYKQLSSMRPYWIVGNMVLSSVLTPPDPFTMMLMALPLQCLYELSVIVAWIWYKEDKAKEAAEAA